MTDDAKQDRLPQVEMYTDGGCDPNPGPGGYGVVLLHPKKRAEASGGFRRTTNNRMEIYAAIKGLELLKKPCKVTLYSDSQYLVKAMMSGWAVAWKKRGWRRSNTERAANADLWHRLLELREKHRVTFVWVRGHAGRKENERCDQLACAALRQPNAAQSRLVHPGPFLENIKRLHVDGDVTGAVAGVVETALWDAPNQRHLAAFKSDADGTARAGGLAFATATAGLAMAAGFALTEPLATVLGTGARFEIV